MFSYAICNETFEGWEHARVCATVAELGYTGLELAPFTLAPRITDVTQQQRATLRKQAEDAGVRIIGLHWLLAKTEGLHLTSTDEAVRRRTAEYLVELARCCRDLGGDILVFGSPKQRNLPAGISIEKGMALAAETFGRAMPGIAECGVRVCLEPLTSAETDFITSCAQGLQLVELVNHPNLVLHLDVKAMSSEATPVPELIRQFGPRMGHFHANDPNLRGPGFGNTDFVPIFRALKDINYKGWISVEVFDYTPNPVTIARESIRYMRECAARI